MADFSCVKSLAQRAVRFKPALRLACIEVTPFDDRWEPRASRIVDLFTHRNVGRVDRFFKRFTTAMSFQTRMEIEVGGGGGNLAASCRRTSSRVC